MIVPIVAGYLFLSSTVEGSPPPTNDKSCAATLGRIASDRVPPYLAATDFKRVSESQVPGVLIGQGTHRPLANSLAAAYQGDFTLGDPETVSVLFLSAAEQGGYLWYEVERSTIHVKMLVAGVQNQNGKLTPILQSGAKLITALLKEFPEKSIEARLDIDHFKAILALGEKSIAAGESNEILAKKLRRLLELTYPIEIQREIHFHRVGQNYVPNVIIRITPVLDASQFQKRQEKHYLFFAQTLREYIVKQRTKPSHPGF